MPLYEYECKKCPECGGPVEQVISAPAVQFKGAGWYVTDYAKKSATGTAASNGEPSSKKEEKSKPEAVKSEAKSDSGSKKEKK